jgi:riboflavin synthase
MFTGLVEAWLPVRSFERRGTGARLVLPAPPGEFDTRLGDSISVSGACLTVAAFQATEGGREDLVFDLSAETLERTWLGGLAPGRAVNLERALRMGDRLGGHLVSGHVDGLGTIVGFEDSGDGGRLLEVEVAAGLERYLFDKGSVTLDGVSLTVVRPAGRRFQVALIPVTLAGTSLGRCEVGQPLNVEADLVGKWIERLVVR